MKKALDDPFTDEQLSLINHPKGVYVEACPGAGKTQTIVERFVSRPHSDSRRGVALISFTNAAVDEVRQRCSSRQDLLQPPNFVGTIDAFVNRFITGPIYASRFKRAATFKDSWEDSNHSTFTAGSADTRFELHWFDFDIDGRARLNISSVNGVDKRIYRDLSVSTLREAEAHATGIFLEHLSRGVVDCSYSRIFMASSLSDVTTRERLSVLLRARFSEVIIDEVQDCSPSDIALLGFLIDAGVSVVMVGDPDQAIYGFRGSQADSTRILTSKVDQGARLSGNFRSTAAICHLVGSLRAENLADTPVGPNGSINIPILLRTVERLSDQSAELRNAAARYKIGAESILCLAHFGMNAQKISGDAGKQIHDRSTLTRIAVAADTLRDIKNVKSRPFKKAHASLLARIRELHPDPTMRFASDSQFVEQLGISHREFQSGMASIVYAGEPFRMPAAVYRDLILEVFAKNNWEWADGSLLSVPNSWPEATESPTHALRWSTVHGQKGLEEECIAIAVPTEPDWAAGTYRDSIHCWASGMPSEPRRVLYVAASRARKLVVIVAENEPAGLVKQILVRDQVPYELI